MAAVAAVRALHSFHRSVMLQRSFVHFPAQSASTILPRSLCSVRMKSYGIKENKSLLDNLNLMGVDVKAARRRQPAVLRKGFTNEEGFAEFMQGKGASREVIASMISRCPRAITRTIENLEQRWELWRDVFQTDAEIVSILDRSPESFFRSSDNENLKKNIAFLTTLGLTAKDLHRLLTAAPRTFSNSLELNKQMVEFLEDICAELGGTNPEQFPKSIISRNRYLLIRSTKRVKENIDFLRASMSDSELLDFLEGPGVEILGLSHEYLKNNFKRLQQKMISLGAKKADVKKLILTYPEVLYIGSASLSSKLDCLLSGGITLKQIIEKPRVLDYSTQNITERLRDLKTLGYDFQQNGISILDSSRKRFDSRLKSLSASRDD